MNQTRNRRLASLALAALLSILGRLDAQETTSGSLSGAVRDGQGAPVPGATATLTSDQGSKAFVTDAQGRFFAPYLTPGRYQLRVTLTGFAPLELKDLLVRLGSRTELPELVLRVGGVEEVVEVIGSSPAVDTSSTTAGGVLDNETLKRFPVGRNFTDALYLVAGVSDSSGVGRANPSIAGSSGLDNNYVVDGVNISNAGFGGVGTYSIVFGSMGTGVTQDFIKETQVKTGGFEAEYGQATGGVVNVVTQSGSNVIHGAVYGYLRPYGLTSDFEQLQTPNGTVNTAGDASYDAGVSLGGPLVKDRLFAFAAFNPQWERRRLVAPEGFPLSSLGEVERRRRIYSYAAKVSWQAGSNHRIDASFFGDPSKGELGPQRTTALLASDNTRFSELTYGGHQQSLRYDGIVNAHWLLEASFARSTNSIDEKPQVDEWQGTDRTVVPNRPFGGIGFYDKGGQGENLQYQLKSTHIFDLAGNHQVRYGAAYEDISFARDNGRTGPPFTLADGTVTRTGASSISILPDPVFGRIYRVGRANFGPVPETTAKYYNLFLQDTWKIAERLILRPGVRWERQRLVGGGTPLCSAATGQPEDFTVSHPGDAQCERTFSNNFSPRLGATYDLFGSGQSKVYAAWGRFLSKVPNDLAARALSADAGISRADYFDAALTRPIPNGVLAGGQTQHLIIAGAGAARFDTEAQPTYQQELLAGVEFELAPAVSVGVRYTHRSTPRVLEDVGTLSMTAENLSATPGNVEYYITNIGPQIATQCYPGYACSFETPVHEYDAVEVTLNKAFSGHWGLLASYRWSRLSGNFEGFFRSDNGQSDPSITSLFDYPTNDPSYSAVGGPQLGFLGDIRYLGSSLGDGRLPNDRTHQIKVYGSFAWRALTLGLGFNAGSGRVLTALAANPSYNSPAEIPMTVRGAGLQTAPVSGCDACGGYRERTPFEAKLDLHADYTLKLGRQRVVLLADVFNLLDRQAPTEYDTAVESAFGAPNPNFRDPTSGAVGATPGYDDPRQVRLGARLEW